MRRYASLALHCEANIVPPLHPVSQPCNFHMGFRIVVSTGSMLTDAVAKSQGLSAGPRF
jgi:hypothetical protein